MPFEKTSRSPRFPNWRGKKRSWASIAASRGKPWNDVFAARMRIANVVIWTTQNMKPNAEPLGNVARATCETTEALPDGSACISYASHDTPMKRVIAITREDAERAGGVPGLRMPERADAVRDRLDAGERARPGREGAQEREQGDRARPHRELVRHDGGRAGADRAACDAGEHEREHREDERVGRDRERDAGLADTAQVDERDQDDGRDRQLHRQVLERRAPRRRSRARPRRPKRRR